MAKLVYRARLESTKSLTPTIRELELSFEEPPKMPFQAGQFLIIHVPRADAKPAPRAYSLASCASEPESTKLIIKLVPGGLASDFIAGLKGGEPLEVTGPFGKCLFRTPPTKQILFVCTGAGLSQHMSFLLTHGPQFPDVRFRLLIGVWNEQEVFYKDELELLKRSIGDFVYEFVLDQGSPSWTGRTGFVTDHLGAFDYLKIPTTFYLCGNPAMIKGVKALLATQNFDRNAILEEAFL